MSKKDDKKEDKPIKQDAPGAIGEVNENTNATGPMTPSEPYPEGTPTATQVAPPPTPDDYLSEQEKGAGDPIQPVYEQTTADVLNIPKNQPYPTQDSVGYPYDYVEADPVYVDPGLRTRPEVTLGEQWETTNPRYDREDRADRARDRKTGETNVVEAKEPYPTGDRDESYEKTERRVP